MKSGYFQLFEVEQFVSSPPSSPPAPASHSQVRPPRSYSQRATQCSHGDGPPNTRTHTHTQTQLHEESEGDAVVGGAQAWERKWKRGRHDKATQAGDKSRGRKRRAGDVSDERKRPRRKEE